MPLIPTTLSLRTFEQLDAFLETAPAPQAPRVLGFFSMVDSRKKLHRELIAKSPRPIPRSSPPTIPAAIDIERMGVHRAPVTAFAPKSRAANAYRALWSDISDRIA